jgi:hypothetical protein
MRALAWTILGIYGAAFIWALWILPAFGALIVGALIGCGLVSLLFWAFATVLAPKKH